MIKSPWKSPFHKLTGFKFKKRNTLKPLNQMVPELLSYIQREEINRIIYNDKLFQIFNGNLLKFVEESLQKELSNRAFLRSRERIPPCNILKKVVDKTSKVYQEDVERDCLNETDKDLMKFYCQELDINTKFSSGNELLNLHKYFAIEPYLDGNAPNLRIIPAHQFLIYSDSLTDPTKMTVFIKFMGTIKKEGVPVCDKQGRIIQTAEQNSTEIPLYYIYSDSEFMILDKSGEIHENRINPYGKIPFIVVSVSKFELLPTPDSDNLAMSILIPKLLGDLNYSAQFATHSVMYGIDVDVSNLENNPDSFWCVKSDNKEGSNPAIGTISPTVNIDQVLSLVNSQMALWLDCKGVKVSSMGGMTVNDATSGVSKMIDSSDASSIVKKQQSIFNDAELYFWDLLKTMHNYWVSNSMLAESLPAFSEEFTPNIKFSEIKILPTRKELLDETKIELDMGVLSLKRAISKLNPKATSEMIEEIYNEIQEEKNSQLTFDTSRLPDLVNSMTIKNNNEDVTEGE